MKSWTRAAVVVCFAWASPAWAGAFYVPEVGARATGMAAAVTAVGRDATAAIHNPAAMSGTTGTQIEIGGALLFPNFTFFRRPVVDPITMESVRFSPASNTNTIGGVPYAAFSTDMFHKDLRLGLALHIPFGAGLHFPEDGAQRHVMTDVQLRTIYVTPAFSYRIFEGFSIGGSISYIYGDFALNAKNILQFVTGDPETAPNPDPSVEGDTMLNAKDLFSISGKLGLYYEPPDRRFAMGVSILLPTQLNLEGDADITNPAITPLVDNEGNTLQGAGRRQDEISIEFPLPTIISVGAVVRPIETVTLSLDVSWQNWSQMESLTVDFKNEHDLLPTPGANLYDVTNQQNWQDTIAVRFGAEYEALPKLQFRLGFFYDQSPVPDRFFDLITPDSDKLGGSVGAGYRMTLTDGFDMSLDLAFMHIELIERDIRPNAFGPGTEKTILNKAAPSFHHGVTRARLEMAYLTVGLHL